MVQKIPTHGKGKAQIAARDGSLQLVKGLQGVRSVDCAVSVPAAANDDDAVGRRHKAKQGAFSARLADIPRGGFQAATRHRRLAGAPVRGENYFKADIAAGRVGPEQSMPRREFD